MWGLCRKWNDNPYDVNMFKGIAHLDGMVQIFIPAENMKFLPLHIYPDFTYNF